MSPEQIREQTKALAERLRTYHPELCADENWLWRRRLAQKDEEIAERDKQIKSLQQTVREMRAELSLLRAQPRAANMAEVLKAQCERYHLTPEELKGRSHERRISWPRQEAYYLCQRQGNTLKEIGAFFGGRDHTTVHSGIEAHTKRMQRELNGGGE
jgi:chromosomal replication initiation ATPase DnaA